MSRGGVAAGEPRAVISRAAGQRLWVPLAVVVLWELCSRYEVVDPQLIPPPSTVLQTFGRWVFATSGAQHELYTGNWIIHATSSARRVVIGFLIAAAIGVPVGILIGWYRVTENLIDPIIQMLRPIPITAWVPFAVVFFGIREPSAIFLIVLGAFFPIVVNATAGAQRTPRVLVRAGLMLGIPEAKLLPKVVFPSALPSIFTGLRLGIGVAWVLVIVAEMLAVKSGLGYVLWDAYFFLKMDVIIAAMISVGVLGFVSDRIILWVGNGLLKWSRGLYESR